MSNREGRLYDSNRYRSRDVIHSSPKRHRRDWQPEMERKSRNIDMNVSGIRCHGAGAHRHLKDTLDLEYSLVPGTNWGTEFLSKETEKKFNACDDFSRKTNGLNEGTKKLPDSTEIPRSLSYFQHDERGSDGKGGYNFGNFGRRLNSEVGWWKDPVKAANDEGLKEGRPRQQPSSKEGDDRQWLHERYAEMDAGPNPPNSTRKRPAFREKKAAEEGWGGIGVAEDGEEGNAVGAGGAGGGRGRRGERYAHHQVEERRQEWGLGRERERYTRPRVGWRGGRSAWVRPNVDKWKHDMFDAANRSPTPNNVDDHIATVEALLDS